MSSAIPSSITRYPSTSTTSRSFLAGGRSRTTSETTTSDRLPESMKPKTSGPSIWSNDGDPFAATSPTTSVHRSTSVRSTSPPTRPTMISTAGIAGGTSTPQQPPKKHQRMSLLLNATSDALFSSFGSRRNTNNLRGSTSKPSSVKKQASIDDDDMSPVLDIRAPPSTILQMGSEFHDEEAEREALRHEAARSVGLTSTTISPPPPDLPEEDESYAQADASYEFIRRPSAPHSLSGALSPDHASSYAAASSTLATMRSAASSQASLSVETTHQTPITPSRPLPTSIPSYPATLASLSPFISTSSTLMRHYNGGSFFLGKARQWKSRHIVLTSFKPPPKPNAPDVEPDTQSHLHLFRNFASEEKELERMKIDEDSVVFVVEDDPVTQGRNNVIRVGGRHAGGGGSHSAVGRSTRTALAPPSAMASLSVMGAPAMAVQMGGQMDFKVVWLLQCPDSQTMHQWIAAVKGALLVQRAERAGLGMSMGTVPGDVRLTGDIDVILSLRAQGLLQHQPSSPTSPTRFGSAQMAAPSAAPPVEDVQQQQPSTRGGRSRSSTTTNAPSAAVNALKGLFTSSVANGTTSGAGGGGLASRPRSISSVASTPIPVASPAKKPMPLEEDPKDSSFGTRANAMLNMHLSRSTNGHGQTQPPSSASSLGLDRSIRDSLYYDEPLEMDFEMKQKDNRERLNALAAFAASGVAGTSSYERPPSLSSLPPPPRTKRPNSSAGQGGGQQQSQLQPAVPRTPVFEKDLQEELKKAMFAPVLEPASRSRTNSIRRNSTDTIPEEDDVGSSVGVGGGRGSSMGRHGSIAREVLSIRTSIDEQGRVSIESSNRGDDMYSATTIPFPAPGSLLPPAELDNGLAAGGGGPGGARSQFGPAGMKSSASFGVDLIHAGQQQQHPSYGNHHPSHSTHSQHQYHRPASAMSSVSTSSFHGNGSATPGASDHMSLHMSPRSGTSSSEGRRSTAGTKSPSSPQRSRRIPKVMIPPPAPPPSAPLPGTPKTEMSKALHPEDASVFTKERDSRSSFFASKRVSAASSTGVSISSFTSGSSSSRSGSILQRSGVHAAPPRPPPTFALPPTPGSLPGPMDSPQLDGYSLRDSVRSTHRTSLNSTHSQSHSPTRSEFGVVGPSGGGGATGMGTVTMGKRLLHRLTPPSNPPPTGALPPRPDSDEPPLSPLSHRSGSSGSLSGHHQQQQQNYHHRTSSIISNGGGVLSTIPASPVDKVLPDLSPLSRSPDLPEASGKRAPVTSSPSFPPASLNGVAPGVSVSRQSSLKSRLRMLSTPSPRLQPSMSLPPAPPPTSALPDTPTITHAMKIVDHSSMSFDLALPSPTLDRPIMSPYGPDDHEERAAAGSREKGSSLLGSQTPPIPPRSQARPTSPRLKLPEASQPPMMGLPLSPPPARRGSRLSKDFSLSGVARVNAALALDSAPSTQTPPVLENDDLDPMVEQWEPSRRESVMIPL